MSVRLFATLFGLVFVVAGAAGFVPGLSPLHDHPDLHVTAASRLALGLFPVNVLHNLVHLGFGLWGLLASRSVAGAVGYARGVAILYAVLTVLGLIPATETLFGLVPLYGNDIWLHALLALIAAYFGFFHTERSRAPDSSFR